MVHTTVGMTKTVTVVSDVKDLSELLRGASVDEARLVPVEGRLQLELALTRAMIERKATIRQGFVRRVKMPWTKCQLTVKQVQAASVKRLEEAAPDEQPLLSCEAVAGGYQLTVQAYDGLQLILKLAQLDGAFSDVGTPIEFP